jgi:hypothetical protein
MKGFPSREQVEQLRQQYPKGTKICCDYMSDDPRPIHPGTIGEVIGVDDAGQVMTRWSNGSSLSIIPGVHSFHVVQQAEDEEPEIEESQGMLVYIPQQTALKKKLDKMRSRLPKERINSGFSRTSNFIEYNYCNYDVKKVQSDFEEASKRLAEAQMALDRINTTVEFEADI